MAFGGGNDSVSSFIGHPLKKVGEVRRGKYPFRETGTEEKDSQGTGAFKRLHRPHVCPLKFGRQNKLLFDTEKEAAKAK